MQRKISIYNNRSNFKIVNNGTIFKPKTTPLGSLPLMHTRNKVKAKVVQVVIFPAQRQTHGQPFNEICGPILENQS